MRKDEIDTYAAAAQQFRDAIAGLTAEQLKWKPSPDAKIGLWSIHEILVHMADSDAIGVHRMKRVIAEEKPLLIGYDESAFIRALHYHEQSADEAITLFDLGRRSLVVALRTLLDSAWSRIGIHNEIGAVTLDAFLHKYNDHVAGHLKFIKLKRDAMKA